MYMFELYSETHKTHTKIQATTPKHPRSINRNKSCKRSEATLSHAKKKAKCEDPSKSRCCSCAPGVTKARWHGADKIMLHKSTAAANSGKSIWSLLLNACVQAESMMLHTGQPWCRLQAHGPAKFCRNRRYSWMIPRRTSRGCCMPHPIVCAISLMCVHTTGKPHDTPSPSMRKSCSRVRVLVRRRIHVARAKESTACEKRTSSNAGDRRNVRSVRSIAIFWEHGLGLDCRFCAVSNTLRFWDLRKNLNVVVSIFIANSWSINEMRANLCIPFAAPRDFRAVPLNVPGRRR